VSTAGGNAEAGQPEFITIARVIKAQGRVGEVLTELHTDFPERFAGRRTLYAWDGGSARRQLHLEEYWPHKGGMVLKFEGVDSIEEAERLRGSEIQIPAAERAELEEGAYYVSDLTGCAVIATSGAESGGTQETGRVVDVNFGAGTAPLLVVRNDAGREFLIPFVESFLERLDLAGKRIEMRLPEGMLELDAPVGSGKKPGAGKKQRPAERRKR
jgi:16S rRNA processing protein RimM